MLMGKTAVITGASRGIGRAIALMYAKNHADIAVIYSGNETAAKQTAAEITALGVKCKIYQCDVSSYSQVSETFKEIYDYFGKIDILVNNAGKTCDKLLIQMTEEDFDSVVDVNLKGVFNTTKAVCRNMAKQRSGKIINISSVSGMMGNPGQANYSASKAGVIGFSKTVAKEFGGRGVTCNVIAPGFVETDMTQVLSESVRANAVSASAVGRLGNADEIAGAALFFASELSSFITGEVLKVDGGLYI